MKKILSLCAMVLTSVGLMAQSATYTGSEKVVVGGTYTYTCDDAKYQLTFVDETLNVTIEEKSVAGTVMGDLTLGTMVIDNLTFDAEKGGYYRDYTGSDVSMTLVAVSNGERHTFALFANTNNHEVSSLTRLSDQRCLNHKLEHLLAELLFLNNFIHNNIFLPFSYVKNGAKVQKNLLTPIHFVKESL
jgi:hypothetical protein